MKKPTLKSQIAALQRRLRKVEAVAHTPFDFRHLVRQLDQLECDVEQLMSRRRRRK